TVREHRPATFCPSPVLELAPESPPTTPFSARPRMRNLHEGAAPTPGAIPLTKLARNCPADPQLHCGVTAADAIRVGDRSALVRQISSVAASVFGRCRSIRASTDSRRRE